MSYDANGIPAILKSKGTFNTNPAQITGVTSPVASLPQIVNAVLAGSAEPQNIVIDLNARKVYAGDEPDLGDLDTLFASVDVAVQTLRPVPSQDGRTLEWEEKEREVFNETQFDLDTVPDAIKALVDAQRPRRTIQSLISAIMPQINVGAAQRVLLVIDQTNGLVHYCEVAGGAATLTARLDAYEEDGFSNDCTDGAVVSISEAAEDSAPSPLKFEGGAV